MTNPARPRAYLAGPDVFLPNAAEIGRAKQRICEAHGIEGAYPGDGDYRRMAGLPPREAGVAAFDVCIEMIDSCQLGFVNMTPFRGPSMDVGTAVEMGYMYAKGLPVFGYSAARSSYAERIQPDGLFIEPFDLCEILMAPGAVKRSTGELPVLASSTSAALDLTAMDAFAECVRRAAVFLAAKR
ncbi:nucleoside 2-deoxyribosyltransferase [Myxococcota bacterium]|nr:nucleoside 2-deoxyribosyltransferase [Myxococcota bacterium]